MVASSPSSPSETSSFDTFAPSSEFPVAHVVALPGIRRQLAIHVRPRDVIPFGRPYRTHPNGPRNLLTTRKRFIPLPARRLTWRRISHPLSIRHSSPDSTSDSSSSGSSLDSSSYISSGSPSYSLSHTSSVCSLEHDTSDQTHSGPSTKMASCRLVYLLVMTPRYNDGANVSKDDVSDGSDSLSTSKSSEHKKGETNGNSDARGKESFDGSELEKLNSPPNQALRVKIVSESYYCHYKEVTTAQVEGNPQMDLHDKGVSDSGCSRHVTGNMSYLTDYEEIDGGYVAFGENPKGEKIIGKCTIKTGSRPDWLFNIDALKRTTNYEPIVAGTWSNGFAEKEDNVNNTNNVNTVSLTVNTAGTNDDYEFPFDLNMSALEDVSIFNFLNDDEDDDIVADINNIDITIQVSPIPTTRIHKDHPLDQVIGDLHSSTQTRNMTKNLEEHGFMSSMRELTFFLGLQVKQKKDMIFISQYKYVQECKHTYRNSKPLIKDEDGEEVDVHMYRLMIGSLMYLTSSRPGMMFAVSACARYKVNPKVSHLHAVKRIFRASLDRKYTTGGCQFFGCRLISWQCKKYIAVANSTTEAEYVVASSCCGQVLWIQINYLIMVLLVILNTAEFLLLVILNTVSSSLLLWPKLEVSRNKKNEKGIVIRNKTRLVAEGHTQEEGIDYNEVFAPIERIEAIRLFLAYASFKDFVVYQMNVKSAFLYGKIEEEVYVCQPPGFKDLDFSDKVYKKFGFTKVKNASTPMETQKPLLKDKDGEEVDVHMYRLLIGSLMYLISSRPDIMFTVCACATYQVNPKVSHLYAMKMIFRYLKGQPKLSLWYPKDSPFDLVAYTDSDYAGVSLDKKFTTGGCQFLGCRLISWQCKKQTVVANSITEAKYVAALSCYGQVLWIQNQLLDYGVDGKKVIIPEASRRKDLQFAEKGVDCLPNSTIFEQLASIGTVASAIICLVTNQKFNFSKWIFESMGGNLDNLSWKFLVYLRFIQVFLDKQIVGISYHERKYISPSHTKKFFGNMRRIEKGFSRRNTPLFLTMVVQSQLGEGSAMPTDPNHIPIILQSSSSQPQKTHKPRKLTRKVIKVPQPSEPMEHVADEAVYKELDDSLVRAATTASSLEAKYDSGGGLRCQEAMRDTIAQTRFDNISKLSNDPLLTRGLQSDEDRMKLNELMKLCTNLQTRVLDLEKTKTTQAREITSLKRRVKKLEKKQRSRTHKIKRLYKVGLIARVDSSEDDQSLGEDTSKHGRKINDIDANEHITPVYDQDDA
nr:hypothetical protein [Tanacetum cinerariifolium]